ncbi:hypothetical protein D9T18_12150 [Pseudoalteromonas agarivorans]|uniref:Uncharacterized protein n=1 Tax=Pseudoalteromonas agarivorans TaxID=176102 RepID=A0AAD0XDK3_9GAMM|nr:hypothetical protein D9T18_12150 [Pseudoalteromonas agarivorans]
MKLRSLFLRIVGVKTPAILLFILKIKKEIFGLILSQKKAHNAKLLWAKSHNEKGVLKSIG